MPRDVCTPPGKPSMTALTTRVLKRIFIIGRFRLLTVIVRGTPTCRSRSHMSSLPRVIVHTYHLFHVSSFPRVVVPPKKSSQAIHPPTGNERSPSSGCESSASLAVHTLHGLCPTVYPAQPVPDCVPCTACARLCTLHSLCPTASLLHTPSALSHLCWCP